MSDLPTLLETVRQKALKGGLPTRRKDGALYGLLTGILFICEKVDREGLHDELREAIRVTVDVRGQGNAGKGRRFSFKGADAPVLVCRHVLGEIDTRDAVYRYARALREARKRGLTSGELSGWLKKNGGLLALTNAATVVTNRKVQIIHLDRSITYPTSGEFTLTLEHDGKGAFIVRNQSG